MSQSDLHRLTGPGIFRNLIRFALPFLGANILMSLYGTADILIVSYFANSATLSATSTGAQAIFTVMALAMGLNLGGTILIGQYFGAKKENDVIQTIGSLFNLIFKIGLGASVLLLLMGESLVGWLRTPLEAQQGAKAYVLICGGGILFTFLYEALSAVLKGLGDSKTPLKFIGLACTLNVILDLVFVAVLGWGAAGAAAATVIAQAFSVFIGVLYLKRKRFIFDFRLKNLKARPDKIRMILKLGIPTAIQHTIILISFSIMTAVVNQLGVIESAVMGITNRIDGFLIMPTLAFSSAISVITAQNMGIGRIKNAQKSVYCGFLLSLIIAIPSFLIMYYHPESIMRLLSSEPEIIMVGGVFMHAYSPECLLLPIVFCMNGFFNGCGRTGFTMLSNMTASVVFRVPLILKATDIYTVGLATPISTIAQIIFTLGYFITGRWKKRLIR